MFPYNRREADSPNFSIALNQRILLASLKVSKCELKFADPTMQGHMRVSVNKNLQI